MSTAKKVTNQKFNREKDLTPVRGKFFYYEVPGGVLEFSYRKYREDKTTKYSLRDGEIYTIPLMVAKHLNNDCWYPVHEHYDNRESGTVIKVGTKIHRCGFQSLEFMDVEDLTPKKELLLTETVGVL